MPKYTVKSTHLAGFAVEKTEAGQQAKILVKQKLITSDNPMFHVYMKHITDHLIAKTKFPAVLIHQLLIVLHKDDVADIYINDFEEIARMQVKDTVKAGENVPISNISDITHLKFPGIEIKKDDVVIYCLRVDWRFSLYFDFSRDINLEQLSKELGELKKEAEFYRLRIIPVEKELNRISTTDVDAIIFVEGKSDWKHLKKAVEKLGIKAELEFLQDDVDRGSKVLIKICEHFALIPQPKKMIFVFDRDEEDLLKILKEKEKNNAGYGDWGNNVYSIYIPEPPGRLDTDCGISIEFFYSDNEIRTKDKDERRLYISDEFHKTSGKLLSDNDIHTNQMNKVKRDKKCIIDIGVFNEKSDNVALSKDSFAENILNDVTGFENFDFKNFQLIFDVIEQIVKTDAEQP